MKNICRYTEHVTCGFDSRLKRNRSNDQNREPVAARIISGQTESEISVAREQPLCPIKRRYAVWWYTVANKREIDVYWLNLLNKARGCLMHVTEGDRYRTAATC